ncbi:MAG: hypothetical protein D3923_16200, partial [Candidatus Electrothrix sp. AR3]|nr:hypothetical protein [Candidatus Electrothrix sp. AR3]
IVAQALQRLTGVRKKHLITFRFQRGKKGDSCNACATMGLNLPLFSIISSTANLFFEFFF